MVFKGSLYIFNILCGMIPCEYKHQYPDTSPLNSSTLDNQLVVDYETDLLKFNDTEWQDGKQDLYRSNDYANTTHPLVVHTTTGTIRGYWMRVVGGRKIRAFEGIPYAEPPINEQRFRAPVSVKPWNGILEANLKGPKCLQYNDIASSRVIGSEHCLFLNIYSPNQKKKSTKKYPVIIYIHGGGFLTGSGTDFGPAYILQRDIVLVTINFRVGVLGFMSTNDQEAPGNAGLKDQAEAINWVHNNIDNFFGDFNRITLVGHGSGAASVHFHMLSFKVRGKFIAGISISGTAFNQWALHTKDQAVKMTKTFARAVHCPAHGNTKNMVSCLREKRGFDLVKMQIRFLDKWPLPFSLFRPVVEEEYQREEAFMTETPEEAYQKGTVDMIPWICGQAEDEGYNFLLSHVALGTFSALRKNWNSLAPDFFNYDDLPIDQDEITRRLNWLYFRHANPSSAPLKIYSDALGARLIYSGIHKALQAHSQYVETYAFMFGYNGKYNLATAAGIKSSEWAVGHGEIVGYIFNSSNIYTGFQKKDSELVLSKILINIIYNFADKQVPGFTTDDGETFHIWNAVSDPRNISFLHIDKKIKMIPEPYLQQTLYWESLGLPDNMPLANYSNEIENITIGPDAAKGFVSTDITVTGNVVPFDLIPPYDLKPGEFTNDYNFTDISPTDKYPSLTSTSTSTSTSTTTSTTTVAPVLMPVDTPENVTSREAPTTSTSSPTTTVSTTTTSTSSSLTTTMTTSTTNTTTDRPKISNRWLAQNFVPMPELDLKFNIASPTVIVDKRKITTEPPVTKMSPNGNSLQAPNVFVTNFYPNNKDPPHKNVPFGVSFPILANNVNGGFITKLNISTGYYLKSLGTAPLTMPGNQIRADETMITASNNNNNILTA